MCRKVISTQIFLSENADLKNQSEKCRNFKNWKLKILRGKKYFKKGKRRGWSSFVWPGLHMGAGLNLVWFANKSAAAQCAQSSQIPEEKIASNKMEIRIKFLSRTYWHLGGLGSRKVEAVTLEFIKMGGGGGREGYRSLNLRLTKHQHVGKLSQNKLKCVSLIQRKNFWSQIYWMQSLHWRHCSYAPIKLQIT